MEQIPLEAVERIGKEVVHVYDVTDKDIRRFAQAIDDPNPLYYDEEYARTTPYKGIIAPPLFCHAFTFADAPAGDLRADGLPKDLDVPLPVSRAVGGSSSFEVGAELRPGDKLTVKSKIRDIYTKSGKTGLLYFTVVETTFTKQNGDLVANEVATYIQR